MDSERRSLLLSMLALVAGVPGHSAAVDRASGDSGWRRGVEWTYAPPFDPAKPSGLHMDNGAESAPRFADVRLSSGREEIEISDLLRRAVQSLGLGIEFDRETNPQGVIHSNEEWSTSTGVADRDLLRQYNQRYPEAQLPSDRFYALSYRGTYDLAADWRLRWLWWTLLYQRSAMGAYRPLSSASFKGSFFLDRLETALLRTFNG